MGIYVDSPGLGGGDSDQGESVEGGPWHLKEEPADIVGYMQVGVEGEPKVSALLPNAWCCTAWDRKVWESGCWRG